VPVSVSLVIFTQRNLMEREREREREREKCTRKDHASGVFSSVKYFCPLMHEHRIYTMDLIACFRTLEIWLQSGY